MLEHQILTAAVQPNPAELKARPKGKHSLFDALNQKMEEHDKKGKSRSTSTRSSNKSD